MKLYFAGTEVPGHRALLAAENVTYVSLSYMGLRRRTKFVRPWVIAEKYPENQRIFLDSGAYTVNRAEEDRYSVGELKDIAAHYMSFVHDNIDRLDMVSEFDAVVLGSDWLEAMREDFWGDLPEEKFLPVWHPETGIEELDRLARQYARVAVSQTDLGGRNLQPTLNGLVNKYGTKLHGIAMTKPDEMAAIRWDSVASTSWLSPSQYGDTIVWTGQQLKRYPKAYKDRARRENRALFTRVGFDAEKIEADDTTEVLRLSIWSWQQQIEMLNRHRGGNVVVSTPADDPTPEKVEREGDGVDNLPVEVGNAVVTLIERPADERINLPGLGLELRQEISVDEHGVQRSHEVPLLTIRSESQRVCDTCFLKDKCPQFKPRSTCAYNIPIEIRTKEQYRALGDALVEMQTQRVMFMRMSEQLEGSPVDPNLSSEIDRLGRLLKVKNEMEQDGYSLNLQIKEKGKAGVISRLFGEKVGQQLNTYDEPISDRVAIESFGIIDAEVVDASEQG